MDRVLTTQDLDDLDADFEAYLASIESGDVAEPNMIVMYNGSVVFDDDLDLEVTTGLC